MGIDFEAGQGFVQAAGVFPHFFGAVSAALCRCFQQINGREAVFRLLLLLILLNLLGHLHSGNRGIHGGDLVLLHGSLCFLCHFGLGRGRNRGAGVQLRHFGRNDEILLQLIPFHKNGNRGSCFFSGCLADFFPDGLSSCTNRRRNFFIHPAHEVTCPGGIGLCRHGKLCCRLRPVGTGFRKYRGCRLRQHLLPLFLHPLTALALVFQLLVGNMVHHHSSRLDVVLLFLLIVPFLSGAVGDGADNAGDGDLHGTKKEQNRSHNQKNITHHIAAGPAQQHGNSAAENTAGAAGNTGYVQVRDQRHSLGHALGLNRQVINTAAQEQENQCADAAHGNLGLAAKGVDHEQIQQNRNGKIEACLSNQTHHNRPDHFQQRAVRLDGRHQKQDKKAKTQQGDDHGIGDRHFIFGFHFGLFFCFFRFFSSSLRTLGLCFLIGRRPGSGRFLFGLICGLFRLALMFLLSHG